jgi:hypothetical protein
MLAHTDGRRQATKTPSGFGSGVQLAREEALAGGEELKHDVRAGDGVEQHFTAGFQPPVIGGHDGFLGPSPVGHPAPVARSLPGTSAPRKAGRRVVRYGYSAPAMEKLELEFVREKETPGTWRYQESEVPGRDAAVGSLYLKKSAIGTDPPERLRVTIEAG